MRISFRGRVHHARKGYNTLNPKHKPGARKSMRLWYVVKALILRYPYWMVRETLGFRSLAFTVGARGLDMG